MSAPVEIRMASANWLLPSAELSVPLTGSSDEPVFKHLMQRLCSRDALYGTSKSQRVHRRAVGLLIRARPAPAGNSHHHMAAPNANSSPSRLSFLIRGSRARRVVL